MVAYSNRRESDIHVALGFTCRSTKVARKVSTPKLAKVDIDEANTQAISSALG